jgi:hypothetical protein
MKDDPRWFDQCTSGRGPPCRTRTREGARADVDGAVSVAVHAASDNKAQTVADQWPATSAAIARSQPKVAA